MSLSRAGCAMLKQAACAPGLEVPRGKGPAAEEGTAAWKGARPHGDAAAAEAVGGAGVGCLPAGDGAARLGPGQGRRA